MWRRQLFVTKVTEDVGSIITIRHFYSIHGSTDMCERWLNKEIERIINLNSHLNSNL